MEDEGVSSDSSYGGGGNVKKKKNKTKAKPESTVRLTPSDEIFPTDLEEGSTITEFDWLTKMTGVLRQVVDQGNRRTCWTIASTRELSARLVIDKRFDPPLELSALHLLVGLIDKVDSTGGLHNLENLRRFMIDSGAILEHNCNCTQLALEAKNTVSKPNPVLCTDKGKNKQIPMFKVKDLVIIKKVDEKELIRLVKCGLVAASIDVHEAFSNFKGDGIYTGPTEKSRIIDNHLLIVNGYGTDKSTGMHYWKVQNSAGVKWGNNGYGKIIRQISRGREAHESLFTSIIYSKLLDHYEGQK